MIYSLENVFNILLNIKISSILIKQLMKDNETTLLDIIFSTLKFYDDEFILELLLYYKNQKVMST